MRLTQGTFSYLPDFTDEEIAAQLRYALGNSWPIALEYSDDPHPRNTYWTMWALPMFDLVDPAGVLAEINEARSTYPNHYIRLIAYDASYGRQTTALSFLVHRPFSEPGFSLERSEAQDRQIRYTTHSYAVVAHPTGERYS